MIWFIAALIVLFIGLGFLGYSTKAPKEPRADELGKTGARGAGGLAVLIALILSVFAFTYQQSVGEAKVIVNAGGTISHVDETPGFGFKAPWQSAVTWDLFSQNATYAGNAEDGAPSYTRGEVQGLEITSSVKGGAQTNFDLSVTYNLNGDKVEELYREFRTQERFTQQVVEQRILSAAREVPTAYEPQEFRGEKRGEAADLMLDNINSKLNGYGVDVSVVNLQNIKYLEVVEEAIKSVEVAQQKEAEAQANLRATEVSAQAQVVEAQAQADANRLLSESLTPQVLEARRIEALKAGTVFVVPDGSQPLVSVNPQQ